MKLSPCKHCGSPAHLNKSITDPHLCWSVACSNLDCGIGTRAFSQQQHAVDAWQRTAYSHRNGETEAPTLPGKYWFEGVCKLATGRINLQIILNCIGRDDRIMAWEERSAEYLHGHCFAGTWWGPILAPWESTE